MLFDTDREALRLAWARAWQRHRDGLPLEPLDAALADVIGLHPEYQALLERLTRAAADGASRALDRTWLPEDGESNPFLHLGMHMAIREQVSTDRPAGIRQVHEKLARATGDGHAAEHRMMEALGEALWEAQRRGGAPDENAYLEALVALIGR